MIKIDKDNTQINGDAATLMSELAAGFVTVTNELSKDLGVPLEEVRNAIYDAITATDLMDSGMGIDEAIKILKG